MFHQMAVEQQDLLTLDLPLARAVRVNVPRDPQPGKAETFATIDVICPFCGGLHKHGWRRPGERLELRRIAHCPGSQPAREYVISDWVRAEVAAGFEGVTNADQ